MSITNETTNNPAIFDQPQLLEMRVYDEVRRASVEALERCPGVRGVFRMGSIGSPGISDLDLVVVASADKPPPRMPDLWNSHPQARYVMMHSPFLVDEDTFSRIGYVAAVSNLERVLGDVPVPTIDEVPAVVRLHLSAKYALDALLFQCRQLSLGSLQVRSTLCAMNTLGHLLALCPEQVHTPAPARLLAESTQHLRDHWFSKPNIPGLWRLVTDATTVYPALLDALGDASPLLSPQGPVLSWMNMEVVAGDTQTAAASVLVPELCRLLDHFPSRSHHLADLRWLLRACLVEVRPQTGGVLSAAALARSVSSIRERVEILHGYTEWLHAAMPSWAMLCPRVDSPEPTGAKWNALAVMRRLMA